MSVSNELAPNRNKAGRSHRSPSSSFIRISQSSACLAVRMPPAGLKPIVDPVRVSYSRIIRAITTPTGSTAFTDSLPVDVLMKSAPAIIATMLARATLVSVARSPVPRIAFMCARPQASRNARTSAYSAGQSPVRTCARVITMSISCAPAATEACTSSRRCANGLSPAGKPVETAATGMPDPSSAATAVGTSAWYTHTAPTLMSRWATPRASIRSGRSGRRALAHSRKTLPGMSSPWSVVISMQEIARSSEAACYSFFTVRRVGIVAARHSRAEAAGIYRGELLRLQALLLALRQPREQRRDFLAEGLIARRTARLVPDDAAERERRFGRRGPVDERLHRAEIAGGTVWLGGFVAEVRCLLGIARCIRCDVTPQALKADWPDGRGGALARLRGIADVAVIQVQHHRCLHLIAGVQILVGHDRARVQRIGGIERPERRAAHVVMTVYREHGCRMMRGGRVDDAFHEGTAVTRFAVPSIRQHIAVGERARQVMPIQHGQAVAHAMDALKQHPATGARHLEWLAQRLDLGLGHLVARLKVGLDHPMSAAGREAVPALGERGRYIG